MTPVEKLNLISAELKVLDLPSTNNTSNIRHGITRLDPSKSSLIPTDGKNMELTELLSKTYLEFEPVVTSYSQLFGETRNAIRLRVDRDFQEIMSIDDYIIINDKTNSISLAVDDFILIDKEMKKSLDLLTTYVVDDKAIEKKLQEDDLKDYKEVLITFFENLKTKIIPEIKKTKDKITAEKNSFAKRPAELKMSDKFNGIPRRTDLKRFVYDFDLFYIRPDGEKVGLSTSVRQLKYTMDYDNQVMPIYTMELNVSHLVVRDFKENLDRLRFFLSVQKWVKSSRNEDSFTIKETVFENQQIVPLDPEFSANGTTTESPLSGIPSIKIIMDFVSKRNVDLNTKTKSKVYSNVTMLDVITAILNESYNDQLKDQTNDRDLVKFVIAPPDNLERYEQVILDPGSVSSNLQQLQEKYGVYRTGIRIMFDTVTNEKNSKGDFVNRSVISVQDKGGSSPVVKESLKRVLIEFIDPVSQTNSPEYESGCAYYENSELLLARTHESYKIIKNNSRKIIDGDSVRIMNSSQNDWTVSECDIKSDHNSPQKTLWSGNDNKFALTQYLDKVRERYLMIAAQVNEADIYAFSQNLKYTLKFYNDDDKTTSGDYRLKSVSFSFITDGLSDKKGIAVSSLLIFTNIPPLMINGSVIGRESYEEKMERMKTEVGTFKGNLVSSSGGGNGKAPLVSGGSLKKSGPFVPLFIGKNDYSGKVVPNEILPSYKMSRHITFDDCYVTKDGSYPERGQALCQNFDLFNYAQRFAAQILDPIVDKYGRFVGGNGRMNSFYRYHIPDGGSSTSAHLWALAADMMLTSGGNALCEPFFWIAHNSGLPFDQLILEGNGSEWRWIHVGMNNKGNNRRQIFVSFSGKSSQMIRVNLDRFTSPDKAYWSKAKNELR